MSYYAQLSGVYPPVRTACSTCKIGIRKLKSGSTRAHMIKNLGGDKISIVNLYRADRQIFSTLLIRLSGFEG